VISVAPGTKVYLACQPVSMRLGFDGLAARVSQLLLADPFCGQLFLFRAKRGKHTTFHIQFASRDDCLSLASFVGADVASLAASARQRADLHLHGRATWLQPGVAQLDVRSGVLRGHDAWRAPDQPGRSD
jgi:transposase